MRLSKKIKPIAAILLMALAYAFMGVAIRLLGDGFEPMTQVWVRLFFSVFASLALLGKNLRPREIVKARAKDWLVLITMGSVGYGIAVYFITMA